MDEASDDILFFDVGWSGRPGGKGTWTKGKWPFSSSSKTAANSYTGIFSGKCAGLVSADATLKIFSIGGL